MNPNFADGLLGSWASSWRSKIEQRPVAKIFGVPLTGKRKLDNPLRNRERRAAPAMPDDPRRLGDRIFSRYALMG
jgi:hypothetical protein